MQEHCPRRLRPVLSLERWNGCRRLVVKAPRESISTWLKHKLRFLLRTEWLPRNQIEELKYFKRYFLSCKVSTNERTQRGRELIVYLTTKGGALFIAFRVPRSCNSRTESQAHASRWLILSPNMQISWGLVKRNQSRWMNQNGKEKNLKKKRAQARLRKQ